VAVSTKIFVFAEHVDRLCDKPVASSHATHRSVRRRDAITPDSLCRTNALLAGRSCYANAHEERRMPTEPFPKSSIATGMPLRCQKRAIRRESTMQDHCKSG